MNCKVEIGLEWLGDGELKMSVVTLVKSRDENVRSLVREAILSGRVAVERGKPRRWCPKHLRYSPFTANGKNHAPSFNPLKHGIVSGEV